MDTFKTTDAMRDIYERLQKLGFQSSFVRNCILPDWWHDKLATVPSNRAYAEAVIARHLGLELASLRDRSARLELSSGAALKLKHRQGATVNDFQVAVVLGERLAGITASSINTPVEISSLSASSIRQKILNTGVSWVGFEELLGFCWGVGIPVVNLCRIPSGNKRPDGMAVWAEDRPVIVIASGKKQPAWHLFILAHELAHIICGHLSSGQVSVDSQVKLETIDKEEEEANTFAVELLSGDPNLSFSPPPHRIDASQLAATAKSIGQKFQIDPGFIALSYSRSQGFIPLGAAALNALSPGANACGFYQKDYSHLHLDDLSEDNRHVFDCLTEVA